MNLKVGFMFLIYYTIISLIFLTGSAYFNPETGYNSTIDLNSSELAGEEIDTGGLFSTGVSLGRFFGFVGFGVGLPEDTPYWFSILFFAWQTLITILAVMFIIDSIWSG